jgi:hypothetical protein
MSPPPLSAWTLFVSVVVALAMLSSSPSPARAASFLRGDADAGGSLEITDGIRILGFLFLGRPAALDCPDAADADDSGELNITDGIYVLSFLFTGGPAPPAPFPRCGPDPTPDRLECPQFTGCPKSPPPPPPPAVDPVTSPTARQTVQVTGRSVVGTRVRVAGGAAPVEAPAGADGAFAITVELLPNRPNRLFVSALRDGAVSAAVPVDVVHDGQPPELFVDEPADGSRVAAAEATVTGRVADLLSGFMGLGVEVAGLPANVIVGIGTNGTFERQGVPLVLGPNAIDVVALDALGNRAALSITVTRVEVPAGAPHLDVVSGNGQTGRVHELLAEPIAVRAVEGDGTPMDRKLVDFRVARSDGRLSSDGSGGELFFQARTGADGVARALWRLGTDAGCGNNRVTASDASIDLGVTLYASARPGPAAQVNVGSGSNQRGEAGSPAPEPLRVWVSDGCNGVAGVPVTFTVEGGDGTVNGAAAATVVTAATGHAQASLVLGPEAGINTVEASFEGNLGRPAVFTAVGVVRDLAAPTSFAGVVLDNAGQPIGGADCSLLFAGAEPLRTRSDPSGAFRFPEVSGAGPANLHVDGLTADFLGRAGGRAVPPGSYPALAYDVVVVPNAENSLSMPVLLPPLDPRNARSYDGSSDVELAIAGVEGVRMTVKAGSMRLADGTVPSPERPAVVALNQVHVDDIPMPMPDGAAPPLAWTLQPAGAHFDPPVAVELPNLAALPPGAVTYFLSFNHDTGRFEIVASGAVSADGSVAKTDPGAGIRTAGWGGFCPPYPVTGDAESEDPCLRIRARKPEGGNVPNGDYLCKNQGQRLILEAVRMEKCAEGDVLWSLSPPEAAEFEGGVQQGNTVTIRQKDEYVSTNINDVVVTATVGKRTASFRLTVFHVNGASGILGVGKREVFPTTFRPEQSVVQVIADFLNLSATAVQFRRHPDAVDPAPGVIREVRFLGTGTRLFIDVQADQIPGDVAVVVVRTSDGVILHRDHMTVVDVEVMNPKDVNGDALVNDPEERNGGVGNEFTFWDPNARFFGSQQQNDGRLTIECKAKVLPDSVNMDFSPHLRWRIFQAGVPSGPGSDPFPTVPVVFWDNNDVPEGRGPMPVFSVRVLPEENDDFGEKTVRVKLLDPATAQSASPRVILEKDIRIEVFWPFLLNPALQSARDDGNFAKNHPGPDAAAQLGTDLLGPYAIFNRSGERQPNWMYYWSLALEADTGVDPTRLRYADRIPQLTEFPRRHVFAATPSLYLFSDGYAGPYGRILIGFGAQDVARDPDGPGPKVRTTGIDSFRNNLIHEEHHVVMQSIRFTNEGFRQSVNLQSLVENTHWSFNLGKQAVIPTEELLQQGLQVRRFYNHYLDFLPAGPGDGLFTMQQSVTPDGRFDDLNEDEVLDRDGDCVPNWRDTNPNAASPTDEAEDQAYASMPGRDNELFFLDWGNPGKMHASDDYRD